MSGDGYAFDPEAAKRVEKGLKDAVAELNQLGFDIEAQQGNGFDDLELSHMEAGHPGLQSTFEEFCGRWGWGVRGAVQDANEIARGLGLSAGIYHEQEQYVEGTLRIAANASIGDPTMSEKDVLHQPWSDIVNPFQDAGPKPLDVDSLTDPWMDTGQDISTSPLSPGMGQDTDWQWGGTPAEKTESHLEEGEN